MTVRKIRRVPINFGKEVKEVELTDDAIGREAEKGLRSYRSGKYEAAMEHAALHQRRDEELTLHKEDEPLFTGLMESGFFNLGKRNRFESEVAHFNFLRRIQGFLPENARGDFFSEDGLGSRLLHDVAENRHHAPNMHRDMGDGWTSDYLRRIGSIVPLMPESERIGFLSNDVPQVLRRSNTFPEFLENTMPYVDRYVRKK